MSNFTRQIVFLILIFAAAFAGYWVFTNFVEGDANAVEPPKEYALPVANPPDILPSFVLPDVNGRLLDIRSWLDNGKNAADGINGKPMLINFWATWCPPCRKELPLLIQMQTDNPELQLVGVAQNTAEEVLSYAEKMNFSFNYPNLVGQAEFATINKLVGNASGSLPYTLLTDADGKVLYARLGELKPEHFEAMQQALLKNLNQPTSESVPTVAPTTAQ